MPTLFSDIYDLFLSGVSDYKINELFAVSTTDAETYLQGFLMKAIPKFNHCKQDLTYILTTDAYFVSTLSLSEQNILSDWMQIQWFNKEINDVTQFQLHLNNTDFRHYAESQNLKAKSDRVNELREIVNQDMTDYSLKYIDWNSWENGKYIVT